MASSISRTVMHKLQFARGIGNREMMRANTLPSLTRAKVGCFARLHIYEENARFILATGLVLIYLLMGAVIFSYLERDNEVLQKREFSTRLDEKKKAICKNNSACAAQLMDILKMYAEAHASGIANEQKERFDFYGALFFSGTVISTIGFGTSTPHTMPGKLASIVYGLVGCTCCVLFFNLFLERLVTALSHILRYLHDRKIARRLATSNGDPKPVTLLVNDAEYGDTSSSCGECGDNWRPSVYKVFVCLSSISLVLLCTAAFTYSQIEGWSMVDSMYFCFTSFATIGFGDMVSHHNNDVSLSASVYRPINFFLLSLGACTFYCLFNVSSIVVRQLLNYIIKKMDVKLEPGSIFKRKPKRYMGLGLRPPKGYDMASERSSIDCQDGLLSLKEFLMNQQSSVLLLQKQLIKNAAKAVEEQKISATRVGPMGILDETFGDD